MHSAAAANAAKEKQLQQKRLQRELTKAIYLAGSERILITFSAGVAQLGPEESGGDAIRRADQAMYLAKQGGRNRVCTELDPMPEAAPVTRQVLSLNRNMHPKFEAVFCFNFFEAHQEVVRIG